MIPASCPWRRGSRCGFVMNVPGVTPDLLLVGSAALLRPEDQVFDSMMAGWRDQQLSRNLNHSTIEDRESAPFRSS